MTAFATITDLELSWRTLTADEEPVAEYRLAAASELLRDLKPTIDDDIADGVVRLISVKNVVCDMVRRSMQTPAGGIEGLSQLQQTTGPFSQNMSFSNPEGNLYLTKLEKQRLGIGAQKAFTIDLLGEQ